MQRAGLALILFCVVAASAPAQAPRSIDPGMSQAQVVQRLGDPTLSRSSGDFTYLFYKNSCGKTCGMDDLVILHKDSVVDAMFRSPERAYSGKSSSPKSIPAEVAARTRPGARDVAAPEAVQAGAPKGSEPAATMPKEDSAAAKTASRRKSPHHKAQAAPAPAPTPAPTRPDSTTRDSIMRGSLRIKVMPKNFVPPRDSARTDSVAKRTPHDE
jgi:pyruvate/2-oxoglutarate dehydrogenase complex dihydrolipoamide acyltransferase (E2) component